MTPDEFFESQRPNSAIKSAIVAKYFAAWSNVMGANSRNWANYEKVLYLDLLSGAGQYDDGTLSTPGEIISIAAEHDFLREKLQIVFNDVDEEVVARLRQTIEDHPKTGLLKNTPHVMNFDVNDVNPGLIKRSEIYPTFSFIDPFGYKALPRKVISSLLKGKGNDLVFFFNYSDVNRAVSNPVMEGNMRDLFGAEPLKALQSVLKDKTPEERKPLIVSSFIKAISSRTNSFALPFGFTMSGTSRESHYLVFMSKSFRGWEIMRDVMIKESNRPGHQLFHLGYSDMNEAQASMFDYLMPAESLPQRILDKYAGTRITRDQLYETDCIGTVFQRKHYNNALYELEKNGQLTIIQSKPKRRRGTYKDVVFKITSKDDFNG